MFAQLARASFPSTNKNTMSLPLMLTYLFFMSGAFVMHTYIALGARSSLATLSVIAQCFAVALLALQVKSSGRADGISCNALMLEAASFVCRLSGTTWRHGYLPVDASGDWLYQAVDFTSLALALWLLREILVVKRVPYEAEQDSFPVAIVAMGCLVVGMFAHANNHDHAICDCLWMTGLLMSVASVIPQYSVIVKSGGYIEALTGHYMAAMGVSRLLSGIFIWNARKHIGCTFWIADFNHAIVVILGAHLLHLVLIADFAYYYLKSVATCGVMCGVAGRLHVPQTIAV